MTDREHFGLREDDITFIFSSDILTEQNIGPFKSKIEYNVYVLPNEVGEPHFHIENKQLQTIARVRLLEAKYQRDNYEKTKKRYVLTKRDCEALNTFMTSKDEFGETMWHFACRIWNMTADQAHKIPKEKLDQKHIPDYRNIEEP